jgi:hypothetical protein
MIIAIYPVAYMRSLFGLVISTVPASKGGVMNISKGSRALRLFLPVVVYFLSGFATKAQCQGQTCGLNSQNCYACKDEDGQACEVKSCFDCRTTICAGLVSQLNSPLLPNGQLATLPESGRCSGATSLALAKLASTLTDGTVVSLFTPEKGPTPLLISANFGNPVLFQQGVLLNRGPKTIASYRIGWVYGYQDRAPIVGMSGWQNALDGIKSNETRTIPKLIAPSVSSINGARLIQFFVAEVKFTDGTTWQQDQAKIREVGVTVRLGRSVAKLGGFASSTGL